MRKDMIIAGIASLALMPAFAFAQTACEQQSANRVGGTVVGAGAGALAGSAIAGRGSHTEGAILGGIAGAVIGNQVSKGSLDCSHAYGYYDGEGRWHATGVSRDYAQGYYDRDGRWVAGAPNGHYESDGRWISASGAAGYYDSNGYWVPASASGYYDSDGRWVSPGSAVASNPAPATYAYSRASSTDDLDARIDRLERRVRRSQQDGSLSSREADRALRKLDDIRADERRVSDEVDSLRTDLRLARDD